MTRLRRAVGEYGIFVALALLVGLFALLSPFFLSASNLLNIGAQASVLMIAAFAMTFVIIAGQIDLSVNSIASLVGVIVAVLIAQNYPTPLAILAGLTTGMLAGFVNGFIVVKGAIPSFIVTLGMYSALRGLTFVITQASTIPVRNESFIGIFSDSTRIFGVPVSIIYAASIFVLLRYLLSRTVFGNYVYAVGGNEQAARLSGVNVDWVKIWVFTLSGLVVAFAGILATARLAAGTTENPRNLELDAIAAVVLGGTSFSGGRGSLLRTVLGVLLIATLNNGLTLLNTPYYNQLIVKGVIVVAAVLLDRWARGGKA